MDKQTMLANQSSVEETVTSEGDLIVERLTKREYFAGLVLQSLLKNSTWIEFAQNSQERGIITKNTLKVADENSKIIANICVKYADALLAQLEAN